MYICFPSSLLQGNICPMGHFCPSGSAAPSPCTSGTYLNSTGNFNETDCISCTAGKYCAGSGNTLPDGACSAGYYCPGGQDAFMPTGYECTQGHYCLAGSIAPARCPSGSYQDQTGQAACKGCPAGYFCDNTIAPVVLYNNSACPEGYYCPQNTTNAHQYPCPLGKFSNVTHRTQSSDCQACTGGMYCSQTGLVEPEGPCDAGYYCTSGSTSKTPTSGSNNVCTIGNYCPQGTTTPQQCTPGTYNPSTGRQSESQCTNCTGGYYCPNYGQTTVGNVKCSAGYYCPAGSDSATLIVCPAGYYCTQGTQTPAPCPAGTYSNSTGLTAESDCDDCLPGHYCPNTGMTEASDLCWGGYYCPGSQNNPNPSAYICPRGMYCPNGSSIYLPCSNGFYASTTGLSACVTCPAGFYCLPVQPSNATLNAQDCPAGYYCPAGTGIDWQPCPAGTYSSTLGLSDVNQCSACDAGKYCNNTALTAPSGNCAAGYYCTSGVDVAMPSGSHNGTGGICTIGHYCPAGSDLPEPCAAGTYQNVTGSSSCIQCPAGYYCVAQTENFSLTPCPAGHYCPAGTTRSDQYKCNAGYYNPVEGSTSSTDCLSCPGGLYCQGRGNTAPTGGCYAGWYCSGGSSSPNTTTHGGKCAVGYYCPQNSSSPTPCDAGKYCQTEELSAPTGDCLQGYYCIQGARTATPTGGITGAICPAGYYCGTGSYTPLPCPPGTYSGSTGKVAVTDCHNCTAGDYCEMYNLTTTNGDCLAGHYCPIGEILADRLECPVGYYCPTGSSAPILCPMGQYQDLIGQSTCKTCPGGYYCDNSNGVVNVTSDVLCPYGHYCPPGTSISTTNPCPVGTFNNQTGLNSSADCTPCLGGYYCETEGLQDPTAQCNAGYYCVVSAETATPSQDPDAGSCPQGLYCPVGTISPVDCPPSTYGAATRLTAESDCTPCTPGSYCTTPGLTAVEGDCEAGYYCELGSNSSQMAICTQGHYCPLGSATPTACPEGTFNPYLGLNSSADCVHCTEGQYCQTQGLTSTTGPCEPGYYCPGGQNSSRPADHPCTIGHYCPLNSSAPIPCANGTYMNHTQGSECYICPEGWYCYNGNIAELCPPGHYCPAGTDFNWRQCPPGTYSDDPGLATESDCKSCPGGKYCSAYAATNWTADCYGGYFCEFGVDRPQPIECNVTDANGLCLTPGAQTGIGGVCPAGYRCPVGSATPIPCAQGTYNNMTGMETCTPCPAGYYCVQGTQDYLDNPCPAGHYCPAGTYSPTQFPCPAGTYYNLTTAMALQDCVPCPPGEFCETPRLSTPTGLCSAGYYCSNGSTTATPTVAGEGGACDPGFYCPQGSATPTSCDPGTYCQTALLATPTGNCTAGYYCILEATSAAPTDGATGNICPTGHYCPAGSASTSPCPTGYFLNVTGSNDLSDCSICTGGKYCPGTGNTNPAGSCDPGYYCPPGQNVSAPSDYNCPVGYFCPGGTDLPVQCSDGEYQVSETQTSCDVCPAGYYCDNTAGIAYVNASTLCPPGHYCPIGTRFDNEFACPIGTFNNVTGQDEAADCLRCSGGYACPITGMTEIWSTFICEAGFFCKQGANSTTPDQGVDADICPVGHYCPQGTVEPEPCPMGTYSNGTGLQAIGDCVACPAGQYCDSVGLTFPTGLCTEGFYCEVGSNISTHIICPAGSYCPEGSPTPTACLAGSYGNTQGMINATSCAQCDPGKYCNDTGLTSPVGDCDPGFYCPGGDIVPNPPATPCPIGLHCPVGTSTPVPCEPGTFTNLTQQASCLICPAGFYCVPEEVIAGNSSSGFRLCPEGYYCSEGTGRNWSSCISGTFSNVLGLDEVTDCQQCTGGYYCDIANLTAPTGQCDAGYFCTSGVDTPQPDGTTNLGTGGICPPGYKCPIGSVTAQGCPAGKYQDQPGQADCLTCVAGHYCTANSTDYTDKLCPSGHYCLNGTASSTQYQCPPGTFNNLTGQQDATACVPCSPGEYCASHGLSAPTDICDAGWYCTLGSSLAQPTSPEGGKCLAGTYCPAGSSTPTGCDPGKYCSTDMLSAVTGNCSAGYYCTGNSTTSQPTGTGGDECPMGHYCVSGSSMPEPCQPGTFLPSTRAQNSTYCLSCTAGKYCNQSGLAAVDGPCDAGYYCPAGQITGTPSSYECPAGHFCVGGSSSYTLCPSGTYQDETRQWTCKQCMEGYYCDNSQGAVLNYTTTICPQGHYCPNGTMTSTEYPCPAGTYTDQTGLRDSSECSPCTGGHYCTLGTTTPTLVCSAGFYCRNSSRTASPTQGPEANECPVGHYCPQQTTEPIKCPIGTFSNAVRLMNESDCTPCTQGFYCDAQGLTAPTGLCTAGFYCETGSTSDSPVECFAGRYCPTGTHTPNRCPTGTFSNATRLTAAANCTACTAGSYCSSTGLTSVEGNCTQGYYCPQGSTTPNQVVCPIAFHCPEGSATPQECPAGSYTTQTGRWECTPCPAGYYCVPDNVVSGVASSAIYDCPVGHFCPTGTGYDWTQCPKGTYSNQLNLYDLTQCTDCPAGKYCGTDGATVYTGLCAEGHWCQSGVDRADPDNAAVNSSYPITCPLLGGHTGYGDLCPIGSYCPEGTDIPVSCPSGTYQDEEGQSNCKGCPAGFYCIANSSLYTDKPCPTGHYCPENTTTARLYPCPIGTYNPNTQQTNSSSCLPCSGGMYCDGTGLSTPAGNCSGGYFCIQGAVQSRPTVSSQGGKCIRGEYCPLGSAGPTVCDAGMYCKQERLSAPNGYCDAGYWCFNGSYWNRPYDGVTGDRCPVGHYCPTGSGGGIPCPMGYYLPSEGSTSNASCIICTLGQYCDSEGLENPTGDCNPGYYCPAGQTSATPSNYNCPAGYFCVGGESAPAPCPSGKYQPMPTQSNCLICPAGYYCDSGIAGPVVNYTQYVCPEGYYCANGTTHASLSPCPLGTYNNITGLTTSAECTSCLGGMACDQTGLTYPLQPCSPGYFCRTGAQSTTPNQGANASICPTGSYCPQQTTDPVPCPEGSFNPSTGQHEVLHCLNCTGGFYCNETGLSTVVGPCFAGFYCPVGSLVPTQEQCTVGNYCPQGSEYPIPCPNGTFSNNVGNTNQSECSPCTDGYYCNAEGLTNVTGLCRQGYYCPAGSSVDTQVVCPIGKYCPTGSASPQDCPSGFYTGNPGAFTCQVCPEGYYCVATNVVAGDISTVMVDCPAGYFCPNGTGYDWQPCPQGTYSSVTGLTQESECSPCTGGYYCSMSNLTAPSGECGAGYFCTSGADRFNPTLTCPSANVHPVIGDVCPIGHYCPTGTDNPIGCPAGTYQDLTNQDHCKACPAGHFCPANTSDFNPNLCPSGHYCPENTTHSTQHPCPPQTFNNLTSGTSILDCVSCLAGMYCAGSGNVEPTGNCSEGFYCTNGSDSSRPTIQGGRCLAGTFCPAGATAPYNCTLGMYCSQDELAAPQGYCNAGFYCPGQAKSPQEIVCPVGHYCPQGTGLPQPCTNGTYAPVTGLTAETECTACDGGFYCNGTGLSSVSGPCDAGFYCPPGQTQPDPYDYRCTPGYYCPANSADQVICVSGEYQDDYQQSTCKDCPAGYFCDNAFGPIGNLSNYVCPKGSYCPGSVAVSNQFPCPPGTYNNVTSLSNVSQCQPCVPGYYCQNSGLPEPEGLCFAGYYCNGSTINPNPSYAICPIGNYCPEGSYEPTACPSGTIATGTGNTNFTDCEPCQPGQYCTQQSSQNGYSLPCDAGYICLTGSHLSNPTDGIIGYICPVGHYCLEGAVQETPCSRGYYAQNTGMSACVECEPGSSCPNLGMNATLPCPAGYYCLNGTVDNGEPCPTGTFSPDLSVVSADNCQGCLPGRYCNMPGLSEPAGNCSAGYLCLGNATTPTPNSGDNKPCPIAHYCDEGTTAAVPCPLGTMRNETHGTGVDDCYPCTGGMYCDTLASTKPAGICAERYYCPSDTDIDNAQPTAYICPRGFYCPQQTADPLPCPAGTYQGSEGSIDCLTCPIGFYCPQNTSDPFDCPAYSYCPEGSGSPVLCPNGTYTADSVTNLEHFTNCTDCVAGQYCTGGRISGPCSAGFICFTGIGVSDPDETYRPNGGPCPYGYYCVSGTTSPASCPSLNFIDKEGAFSVLECQPCPGGRICPDNSTVSEPCWAGYYCPVSMDATKCPISTYNDETGGSDLSACKPCPPGYYCDEEGIANYTTKPCPLGYFCENSTVIPEPCPTGTYRDVIAAESELDCFLCPGGNYCPDTNMTFAGYPCYDGQYCPEGASIVRDCRAGFYCNNSEVELVCPPAYYCPANSTDPTPCPAGSYCTGNYFDTCNCTDAGAIEPTMCPPGYGEKIGALHITFDDTCQECREGTYSAADGSGCLPCRAGVVCKSMATTDDPVGNSSSQADVYGFNVTRSYLCPPGYYCPEGSGSPTPCPAGTSNHLEEKTSLSDCEACPVDHFNHLTGQTGCFLCGSSASQPLRGQSTCVCTGNGRDFQESDRQCPCAAGFNELYGDDDCVKDVKDLCKHGEFRYQNGECFSQADYALFCNNSVCDPGEYIGQNEQKGFCLCAADDLEVICNLECRIAQQNRIQFVCAGAPLEVHLQVLDAANNILRQYVESSLTGIINSVNSLTTNQCDENDDSAYPVHFISMDTSTGNFLGVYNPDPQSILDLINNNIKDNITGNATSDSSNTFTGRRRLLATGTFNGTSFTGIKNPVVCLEYGEFMLWAVDNTNYPIYDRNNLYNTNDQFDYGGFRALIEAQTQVATTTTLFSYRFTDAGTYVFYSSTNVNKKMYLRVMQQNTQCSTTGPFFPATTSNMVSNGIAINQDILQAPDWPVIFTLLGSGILIVILMILALVLFRKYGWMKTSHLSPKFRFMTSLYDFDNYASKGSTVYPVRKFHKNQQLIQGAPQRLAIDSGVVGEVQDDDFWDYDRQVDLEGFSSRRVYDELSRQSRNVTQTLAQQKDEVKQMYNRVSSQSDSLKGLWAAKMNLKSTAALATDEDLANYERKLHDLEQELLRRKEVGHRFEAILNKQQHLADEDEKCREDHQVSYQASLREAHRTLRDYTERLQRNQLVMNDGQFDTAALRSMESRVTSLIEKMSHDLTDECSRLGCWGVLGQGTGAQLMAGSGPASREDLLGKAANLVETDKATGLVKAKPGTKMMLANGSTREVPSNHFVHPQTGRVMPIEGNVAFDPITSRLVFITDSATGEASRTDNHVIPFVPYPTRDGKPIKTKLTPMKHASDLRYGAPMSDPETGLHVPILAVTLHPGSGAILPVGGTHIDVVTGLPTPIELGSLMVDPNSALPVPILSVTLDPESGEVVPLGGVHRNNSPMIPGEAFVEPLSGKSVRLHSGCLSNTQVEPSAGGYQGLLDANTMACEARVADALRGYLEALAASTDINVNLQNEESAVESAIKELEESRTRMKVNLLRSQQDIKRRQDRASILALSGGCPGMYEFSKTGQLLPILIGTTMQDESGSGLEVPVLGAEVNKQTDKVAPLGGTMEDPEGSGLIPINIGKKAVDPITSELSPVIGVRMNPETQTVVPVTLSSAAHRKKTPPPGALAMLEEEIVMRRSFWRRQQKQESDVTAVEHTLSLNLLHDVDSVTVKMVSKALEQIDAAANHLSEAGKREVQRRGAAQQEYGSVLPPEVIAVLTDCDQRECEMEEKHVAAHVKFADMVRKFFNKLQQEEKKFKDKMGDMEGANNPEGESVMSQRYRQAKNRLLEELQGQIITRVEQLDEAHSALEYARQRSELCCQEAKVVLTHSALLAGDYDARLSGIYGDAETGAAQESELVPLLKQLIAMLESGGPFYLSSELINMINNAAGSAGNTNVVNNYNLGTASDPYNNLQRGESSGRVKEQDSDKDKNKGKKVSTTLVKGSKKDKKDKTSAQAGTDADGANDGTAWKDLVRRLFERQAYEAAKLENDLKTNEMTSMQDTLDDFEKKKRHMMDEAREDLRQKLERVDSDKERDRIMTEYATNLQKVNDAFDKQKHQQLETLRQKLLEERRKRKKELYRKQCEEAQQQGVGIEGVPDVNLPGYNDLMRDLLKLQEEQERALAEMQMQGERAQQNVKINLIDPEFEKKIKALDVDSSVKEELIRNAEERNRRLQQEIERMNDLLKSRKNRSRPVTLSDEEVNGLSNEEQQRLKEARELQTQSDREREEQALLEARKLMEKEQMRLAQEEALREKLRHMTEEERDKILAQFQSEMDHLRTRQDNERQTQRDKIVGKLAARKRLQEELEKEKAVAKELDRITKRHIGQEGSEAAEVILDINEKLNGETLTPEQQRLLDEQIRQTEEMERRQRAEQRDANQNLEQEMLAEELDVDTQIQQQKRLAVAEQKNKFDRDMLLNRQHLSEEEYKRLLAEHQRELASLVANLDHEKDRQKRVIHDRILDRRRKRDAQLEEKHRLEMEEEMSRQQQQRDKVKETIARKVEDTELKKNVKNLDGDQAENLIYTVLRQRHLREAIHLEDQLAREMAAAQRRAKAEVEQGRQREREILMNAFEQEMLDLVANSNGMSDEELAQRKHDLKREQKKQRREFDKLTAQLVQQAEKENLPRVEIEQTNQRLGLKEKQLGELSDAMQLYSPSEELKKKYAEDARLAALEAKKFREEVLRRMQEEFERKKKEQQQREEEKKRKLEEHYRKLQQELEEEQKREEQKLREREAEKQRLKQKQLDERHKNEEEEIRRSNMSEEEKQRLLREHQENMQKLKENLADEQNRSRQALSAKLEARRKKRHGAEYAKVSKQLQLEEDASQRKTLEQKQQEASIMGNEGSNRTATDDIVLGGLPTGVKKPTPSGTSASGSSGGSPLSGFQPSGNLEQDWMNLLMASPLFKQINDLEDMLDKSGGADEPIRSQVKGADYSRPYIDVKDAQWTCKGDLVPVDIGQISPSQFVVYRFGVFVIRLLHQQIGTPEVTLLLASNLPPNNYEKNAFRNSIYYEHAKKILFVRKERIESIGEFAVLILHAISHIKVGEITDDGNTRFLRQFYRCLKVVCQDMFFSRSKSSPTSQSLIGQTSANSRPALEQALAPLAKTMDERKSVIGELVNMKVDGEQFSQGTLNGRLSGYDKHTSTARLRQYLASKGGYLATSDFISARMAELRGAHFPLSAHRPSHQKRVPPPAIRTNRDVVDTQLVELQTKNDSLNEELSDILKNEAGLREAIRQMSSDPSQQETVSNAQSRLEAQLERKGDLLKRITSLEGEISRKEKELRSKKK